MKEKLAVPPAIRANDDAVANRDAAGRVGDDLCAARGFRQFLVVGERDSAHDKDTDTGEVFHPGLTRVRRLVCGKRHAVPKNVFFLTFRPLRRERCQAVELCLINHNWGEVVRSFKACPVQGRALGAHFARFWSGSAFVCMRPPF